MVARSKTEIYDQSIDGFDELYELEEGGDLDQLLDADNVRAEHQ